MRVSVVEAEELKIWKYLQSYEIAIVEKIEQGGEKEGEMTQTLYAHMHKIKI
jgi:hypothetical protein